ncbi:MAG: phospholipid carrier-dependent glycosyltransferase [Rhodanobacter sp.]
MNYLSEPEHAAEPLAAGNPRRSSFAWLLNALPVVWLLVWFAGLGIRPLGEPDEGRYAEVAREMFATGDWITPRLDGFNFFDKPVLHYWATGFFYTLFGVHEWTARLWVSLTGLLTVVASGWAAERLYGKRTGWIAAAVLGSTLLFFAGAQISTMDMSVAAFLSVAIALFMVAQFDPRAEPYRVRLNLLGWASLALALLSKGLIGLVLPAIALLVFMCWERKADILRRMTVGWGMLAVVAISAPWFVAICMRHPDFFDYFFIREHFGRFLTGADDRAKPVWFFLGIALLGLFPWVACLPFSPAGWRKLCAAGRSERFLVCWIVVVLVFFSASRSKLPFYILPIFPGLAILVARRMSMLTDRELVWRFLSIAIMAIAMAAVAWLYPADTRHLSRHTDLHPVLVWFALGLCALAGVSVLSTVVLARWRQRLVALLLLGLGTLCVWQLLFANVGEVASELSAKPVARLMLPQMRDDTEIFTVHAYLRGLSFYLQRWVTVVDEDPPDIVPGSLSRPDGFLPSISAFEARWSAASSAVALVDPHLFPRLREDGLPMQVVGSTPSGIVIRRPTPEGTVVR